MIGNRPKRCSLRWPRASRLICHSGTTKRMEIFRRSSLVRDRMSSLRKRIVLHVPALKSAGRSLFLFDVYRDASCGSCTFHLSLHDVFSGLHKVRIARAQRREMTPPPLSSLGDREQVFRLRRFRRGRVRTLRGMRVILCLHGFAYYRFAHAPRRFESARRERGL